jgi:Spy/CpxP family protein refolding chaperone
MILGLVVGAWLAAMYSAGAQEPPPRPPDGMEMPPPDMPRMDVDKELARMTKRYGLSESQRAQIRSVLVDVKAKMDDLSKDSSTDFGEQMQRMRAIREKQTSRISAILSDEQRAKYQKDTERQARDQDGGPPDGLPPPPPSGDQGGGPPLPQGS